MADSGRPLCKGLMVHAGTVAAARNPSLGDAIAAPFERTWEDIARSAPTIANHPRVTLAVVAAAGVAGVSYYWRWGPVVALTDY